MNDGDKTGACEPGSAVAGPVWPIVERPVPGSQTPGEWISPTQPFPTKPAPFDVHGISVDTLTDLTPELREEAMEIAAPYVLGEIFTPPSIRGDGDGDRKGTLQLPGSVGGAEWGGAGFDAVHRVADRVAGQRR